VPRGPIASAVALVSVLLVAGVTRASARLDDLETRDLRLVYPSSAMDFIAPYAARCFENSFRFHRELWGYTPSEKVTVVMDDMGDYLNAGVSTAPTNNMSLSIAPANFVYETSPSNERMSFTMNHELVHVIAFEKAAGRDRLFRSLFRGKVRETADQPLSMLYSYLTVPRRAAPRWYHEGIAVFLETWMAGGYGRAQGPYDEMVFRSMVRDGSHFYDPLGLEAEGTKVNFLVGVNSYLYGTRFMSYLAQAYSPAHLMRWVNRTPGSKAYFAAQFRQVFGKSLGSAWSDWIAWEHEFQRANLDSIRRYPTTSYHDLSKAALGSVSRAFLAPGGKRLYVAAYYPGAVAQVAELSLDTGARRQIQEVKGPALYFVTSLAYNAQGDTLFYTTDNNDWRDLCALDPNTGRMRVLFKDARIGDLVFNPKDHSLWGVRHRLGISSLVRIPAPYDAGYVVWALPYGLDMYDLDISPDGTRLSASMAEVSGRQSLRIMNLDSLLAGDTRSRTLHDFGTAIPSGFVYSPDGRYLFGSSYYTGVSNIFRYDLAADSMDIVSNTETGFFRPIPTTGDSLIVFRYTGQGFVPALTKPRPLTDVSAITFFGQAIVEAHPELKAWAVPPPSVVNLDSLRTYWGPYHALRSIRMTSIYPVVEAYKAFTALGVRANFSDPAFAHLASATVSLTPGPGVPESERVHVDLGYDRYAFGARFRYNGASFYDLVGPTKTSRKGVGGSMSWSRWLVDDEPRKLELRLSLSGYTGLERLPEDQNVATSVGFDKLASITTTLSYRNIRGVIGSVEKQKGWSAKLEGGIPGVRFVHQGAATWRGFPQVLGGFDAGTPLPVRNASLWLRTAAGRTFGDRDQPFANFYFGHFGNNWVDHGEPRRYRSETSFPGTDIDAIAGANFARTLLECNLPPLRFRRAGTLALYAAWAQAALFGTGLVTNLDHAADRQRFENLGVQTDVRFQLLTLQPLTLSLGYARAWKRDRPAGNEWMLSLKLL
jgi:hypothetical protein